ncbi:transposase [bacterium]|nr:transposase [bacterium]
MKFNPDIHHRRSIRIKGYDYSRPGAYFITICTQHRNRVFGQIMDGNMVLNELGRIVEYTWNDLVNHIDHIKLDSFVVMPNHVHGIIVIINDIVGAVPVVGAGSESAPTKPAPTRKRYGLTEIVRQFKTFSSRRINQIRKIPGIPVWQRNYYEHIIRNDNAIHRIREYIAHNPRNWENDKQNV